LIDHENRELLHLCHGSVIALNISYLAKAKKNGRRSARSSSKNC